MSFDLLHIAKSALFANESQLKTVGNNIANVNTPGYSRQRVVQTNAMPITDTFGSIGSGVELVRIERMRDMQLDISYRDENSQLGAYDRMSQKLIELEATLNEPGEYGLSEQINKFFDAWEAVADNPSDNVQRWDLLAQADNLADSFHDIDTSLLDKRAEVDAEIALIAGNVNDIAAQLADLNLRIHAGEQTGRPVNDLEDKYDMLLDELSEYGDVKLRYKDDGTRVVYFGSDELVKHDWHRDLTVYSETSDGVTTSDLRWVDTMDKIHGLQQGQLVGLTTLRDEMIDGYRDTLDNLAVELATQLNAIHRQGYDLGDPPTNSRNFFAGDITGAGDFRLNTDIVDHPEFIAASQGGEEGDNRIALAISELRDATTMNNGHNFGEYYGAWLGKIGRDTANAGNMAELHQASVTQVNNFRESVKGVSLDEEAAKLIQFQQSYQAAAKLVQAADDALNLIIGLG